MATTTAMIHNGNESAFEASAYSIAVGLVGTMEGVAVAGWVGVAATVAVAVGTGVGRAGVGAGSKRAFTSAISA